MNSLTVDKSVFSRHRAGNRLRLESPFLYSKWFTGEEVGRLLRSIPHSEIVQCDHGNILKRRIARARLERSLQRGLPENILVAMPPLRVRLRKCRFSVFCVTAPGYLVETFAVAAACGADAARHIHRLIGCCDFVGVRRILLVSVDGGVWDDLEDPTYACRFYDSRGVSGVLLQADVASAFPPQIAESVAFPIFAPKAYALRWAMARYGEPLDVAG